MLRMFSQSDDLMAGDFSPRDLNTDGFHLGAPDVVHGELVIHAGSRGGGRDGGGSSCCGCCGYSNTSDWAEKGKREGTKIFVYTEIISSSTSVWMKGRALKPALILPSHFSGGRISHH